MINEADRGGSKTPVPETHDSKLPYEKPTLRWEGVFETMALVCGKLSTQGQCRVSIKAS